MCNDRGMTMVEMVIVLSVIMVLCCIGYPSLASMTQRATLRGEASELVGWLQRAKIEAIKKGVPIVVEIDTNSYRVFCDNSASKGGQADWVFQNDEAMLIHHTFASPLEMKSNFANGKLRFNSTIGTKTGTITLADSQGNKIKVIINSAGRIRVD